VPRPDGVRTRGLDIKAGAAKLKADRAARVEAEAVIQRWNDQLSPGREMLWSPTIRAALLAGTPWLDVFCPGCGVASSPRPICARFAHLAPNEPKGTKHGRFCVAPRKRDVRPAKRSHTAVDPR
jgi:hypothetical protein